VPFAVQQMKDGPKLRSLGKELQCADLSGLFTTPWAVDQRRDAFLTFCRYYGAGPFESCCAGILQNVRHRNVYPAKQVHSSPSYER
jgi:hypothetical protein